MKKTILYTDLENVNLDNTIISSLKKTPNMEIFNITYNYHNIQNMLCVSCNNIKLNHFKGITERYDKYILHYDTKYQPNIDFINKIKSIRCHFIDYFSNNYGNIDIKHLEETKNKNIQLFVSNYTEIIKLGSKSEDNINTKINSFEEFNSYIHNRTYNRYNTDRYYLADMLISFNLITYRCPIGKKWKLSFKPYIKTIEFKFNKSKTNSILDKSNNIFISNNILSI